MDSHTKHSPVIKRKLSSGFSLMEALISLTIITFASSILLLSVESTLDSTMDAQE
ncbi:MAG: PulJ/GspJ family protein [Pirellulales bacterium]